MPDAAGAVALAVEALPVEELAVEELAVEEPAADELAVEEPAADELAVEELAVAELTVLAAEDDEPLLHAVQTAAANKLTVNNPDVTTGRFTSCLSLEKRIDVEDWYAERYECGMFRDQLLCVAEAELSKFYLAGLFTHASDVHQALGQRDSDAPHERRNGRPAHTLGRVVRIGSAAIAVARPGQRPLKPANINPSVISTIEASHEGCH